MQRSRIPAIALAIALPLAAVQVVPAPVVAAEQPTTTIPQETEKRARLAAQAIEELINEYRVANGLHPLVTHELYDVQALAWSQQMVADLPARGYPEGDELEADNSSAFRHSNPADWGHSGENIVYDNGVMDPDGGAYPGISLRGKKPFQDTEADWARAAEILFEDWRNSPAHNANMLAPQFQGMGLGLVLNDKGEVWGTTMFFVDNTPLQNAGGKRANMVRDPLTVKAIQSGEPFYTPSGARELLGIGAVADPTDTKDQEVSRKVDFGEQGIYNVISEYELRTGPNTREKYVLDKTKDAPTGLDPEVTGRKIRVTQTSTTTQTTSSTPVAPKPTPTSTTSTTSTTSSTPVAPKPSQTSTTSTTPATSSTPVAPKPSQTSTTSTTSTTVKPSPTPVVPTSGQGDVDKQTPTPKPTPKPTKTETETETPQKPNPAEPNPKDEGSSKAGIAIGVVLGLLAVIGIAVAALPMVAPDLARQLGLPGA